MNTLIIGVGNPLRGDDGAGREAVRLLRECASLPPDVKLIEHGGEGAALMHVWQGADRVILIDAALTGTQPGSIHRLVAHEKPIPARFFAMSSHAFGVAEAIEMARVLGELPPQVLVYGIEGEQFDPGEALSEHVVIGVRRVVEMILADIALNPRPLLPQGEGE